MRAKAGTLFLVATVAVLIAVGDGVAIGSDQDEPEAAELVVTAHQGKLLRAEADIYRVQVVDESICRVIQVTPRELSVVGLQPGLTDLRVWLRDARHRSVTLRVHVVAQ
jgi:Flp pilus assembly secretin CpaC